MDTSKRDSINGSVTKIEPTKAELIQFGAQIVVITIVLIICSINIILNLGPQNLWLTIFSGAVGYLLPNPKLAPSLNFVSKSAQSDL